MPIFFAGDDVEALEGTFCAVNVSAERITTAITETEFIRFLLQPSLSFL
jgi:hypothetical protein